MTQRSQIRSWFVCLCMAFAVMAFVGCSKSTKPKPIPKPTISHEDADDIAQYVGASMAVDAGGWYFLVQSLAESLATVTTNSPAIPDTNVFAIAKVTNNYNFQIAYYNALQVGYPVRDTASSELEADVQMTGGALSLPGSVEGTYGLAADWGLFVYNLRASYDTLEFSGIIDDSSFVTVTSSITPGRVKYWLHSNGVYPTLHVLKSHIPGNPYPVDGEVEFILDAYNMKSVSRDVLTQSDHEILAEAVMTFNSTATATLKILDTLADSAYEFDYSINLKTGAITRLN